MWLNKLFLFSLLIKCIFKFLKLMQMVKMYIYFFFNLLFLALGAFGENDITRRIYNSYENFCYASSFL